MYGKCPYARPTFRKQHSRKVTWRLSAPAFDPSLVNRSIGGAR